MVFTNQSCCTIIHKQEANRISTKHISSVEINSDTVLIYSIQNYMQIKPPVVIMSVKNNLWKITKYQSLKNKLVNDSIIHYSCSNCNEIFNKIISFGLLELRDENELSYPCKSYKDTIINGSKVTEIKDLEAEADIDLYKIEFKIGNRKKTLIYKNPNIALNLCPFSEDRIKFLRIINLLKTL